MQEDQAKNVVLRETGDLFKFLRGMNVWIQATMMGLIFFFAQGFSPFKSLGSRIYGALFQCQAIHLQGDPFWLSLLGFSATMLLITFIYRALMVSFCNKIGAAPERLSRSCQNVLVFTSLYRAASGGLWFLIQAILSYYPIVKKHNLSFDLEKPFVFFEENFGFLNTVNHAVQELAYFLPLYLAMGWLFQLWHRGNEDVFEAFYSRYFEGRRVELERIELMPGFLAVLSSHLMLSVAMPRLRALLLHFESGDLILALFNSLPLVTLVGTLYITIQMQKFSPKSLLNLNLPHANLRV